MKIASTWWILMLIAPLLALQSVQASNAATPIGNQSLSATANPNLTVQSDTTDLGKAIEQWVTALENQPGFTTWKGASWGKVPLGPGMHSWLVIISNHQTEVGYMIVGALEDGKHYKLIEYGVGNQPLYGFLPLYQSMVQHALIDPSITYAQFTEKFPRNITRVYLGPLQAFWQVSMNRQTYFFDAKTGEELPDLSSELLPRIQPQNNDTDQSSLFDQVKLTVNRQSFDPWDNIGWIAAKPLTIATFADFKSAFQQTAILTFAANIYHKRVLTGFATIGFQQWEQNQVYVSLDNNGPSFYPLHTLMNLGGFYNNTR